jgi:hypothetical protein
MMAKLIVVTDRAGNVVGAVRSDSVQTDDGELRFYAPKSDKHSYQEIEVADELLRADPGQLRVEVARRAAELQAG